MSYFYISGFVSSKWAMNCYCCYCCYCFYYLSLLVNGVVAIFTF